MISSSVWAAAPRTQQPLSPAPALLTPTVLAMLCAQLIWKWFDFLPGFLWLCCKWELLRGISSFSWPCIICPLSRWLIQVTDEENRAPVLKLLFHNQELHCTQRVPGSASALGEPFFTFFKAQDFDRLCNVFETFPTSSQRIYIWLLLGAKHWFQSEDNRSNFLAWKCSCRWDCMYPNIHV